MDRAIDYRSKCRHFRTLIIGRANAGKTTLLKRVCNSIEDPEIFSPSGEKLDLTVVQESSERGIHDIENQLIFRSNPQFIFHDSRGFESGSLDEIETVKSFIAKRAQSLELPQQLHAIWYCLPTDTNRPLLEADRNFFDQYGNGKVPVIAIFTKFDGLVTTAFGELRDKEKFNRKEAKDKKFERAREMLKTNFIEPLKATASRPSDYVRLDDMRMKDSSCDELIEKTANVLNDDTLKLLFVSTQQNNIDICIQHAIRSGMAIRRETDRLRDIIRASLAWFPHVWRNVSCRRLLDRKDNRGDIYFSFDSVPQFEYDQEVVVEELVVPPSEVSQVVRFSLTCPLVCDLYSPSPEWVLISWQEICLIFLTDLPFGVRSLQGQTFSDNVTSCTSAFLDKFSSPDELDQSLQIVSGQAYLLASICICAEQTVATTEKRFARAFSIALDAYVKSTVRDKANEAIRVLFEGGDRLDDFLLKGLVDIIKEHRLRIDVDTA